MNKTSTKIIEEAVEDIEKYCDRTMLEPDATDELVSGLRKTLLQAMKTAVEETSLNEKTPGDGVQYVYMSAGYNLAVSDQKEKKRKFFNE